MIREENFGIKDGKEVKIFTLKDGGLMVRILNYGGIVQSMVFDGTDVVLGYDTLQEYLDSPDYYGAVVGRCCNRVYNGKFTLNGKEYELAKNSGINHLHGGIKSFSRKVFDYRAEGDRLYLTCFSPDGEEGYPSNLTLTVCYYLKDNGLNIEYEAVSDGDTVCSLTNHSYFNLNGEGCGDVLNHTVFVDADSFLPINKDYVVFGDIMKVKDTPFDFRRAHKVIETIFNENEQTALMHGYDCAFVLNGEGYRKVASAHGDISKITMEVYTDQPSLQLYIGRGINDVGKGKKKYLSRSAFCFETQKYPNAVNCPSYPTSFLKKGEKYIHKTCYKFKKD